MGIADKISNVVNIRYNRRMRKQVKLGVKKYHETAQRLDNTLNAMTYAQLVDFWDDCTFPIEALDNCITRRDIINQFLKMHLVTCIADAGSFKNLTYTKDKFW